MSEKQLVDREPLPSLVIQYDKDVDSGKGGFSIQMSEKLPIPLLVNVLEIIKAQLIQRQLGAVMQQQIAAAQQGIVTANGALPKNFRR
jgi:hypothetical protein